MVISLRCSLDHAFLTLRGHVSCHVGFHRIPGLCVIYVLLLSPRLTPLQPETLLGGTNLLEVSIGRDFGALKKGVITSFFYGPGAFIYVLSQGSMMRLFL